MSLCSSRTVPEQLSSGDHVTADRDLCTEQDVEQGSPAPLFCPPPLYPLPPPLIPSPDPFPDPFPDSSPAPSSITYNIIGGWYCHGLPFLHPVTDPSLAPPPSPQPHTLAPSPASPLSPTIAPSPVPTPAPLLPHIF